MEHKKCLQGVRCLACLWYKCKMNVNLSVERLQQWGDGGGPREKAGSADFRW